MKKLFVLTMLVLLCASLSWADKDVNAPSKEQQATAIQQSLLELLQQGAAQQPTVAPAPYVAEPKWPQYGAKGELLNPPQEIMLNGQDNGTGQVEQGIICANRLFSQLIQPYGWKSPINGPTGWAVLDSGSEGTEFWTWDKWHKFYYNYAGWYDTVFADNFACGTYPDSIIENWLITPTIDLSTAATCSLIFKQYYLPNTATYNGPDSASVLISIDNGVTWNYATRLLTQIAATANPLTTRLDLAPLGGTNSQVKLAFRHTIKIIGGTPTTTNGWILDNIEVKINGSDLWVQNCSNVMSGWYGDTPPSGPGGAWTILNNCIPPFNAPGGNDWNCRWSSPGNLGNDTVAACTRTGAKGAEFENEWLISPSFSIGASVACTLSFNESWQIDNFGSYFPPNTSIFPEHGYVKIQETTDGGLTWGPWSIVVDNSNVFVGGSNVSTVVKYSLDSWRNKTLRIAFQKVGPPELNSGTWYIKDVSVDDYTPVLDNVGTSALAAPLMATTGRNFQIKPKVFNNGQNAETFQDSAWIYNIPPGATVMSTGFENGGSRPAGWTDSPATYPWLYDGGATHGPGSTHSGSYAAYFNIYSYSSGTKDSLISPSMDLSGLGGQYVLTFWYWHSSGPADSVTVYLDQNGTKTKLWNPGSTLYSAWTLITVPFSSTSSNAKIYIVGYSAYGSYNPYVDDLSVNVVNTTPVTTLRDGMTVTSMPALSTQVLTEPFTWNNPSAGTYTVKTWTAMADNIPADSMVTASVVSYAHTGTGGPDLGFYTFKDDITGGGPAYNWRDISGVGTPIAFNFGTGNGRWTAGIPLGFNFWYYGVNKSRIYIGEDGYISFDSLTADYSTNAAMPSSATPNNLIALFWDDLSQTPFGQGLFWTNNVDTAIVSMTNWAIYASLDTTLRFDAQVIFSKNDGRIKMQYRKFEPGITLGHTIGIENSTGLIGLQYVKDGAPMGNLPIPPLAITFAPRVDDIAATLLLQPTTATYIEIGVSTPLIARFNNYGAAQQTFDARAVINDGVTNFYDNTVSGVVLNPSDSITITFPNFIPARASVHTITITANNPGDEFLANNTITATRTAIPHDGYGGPDAAGYWWRDNTTLYGPTYGWVDTTGFTAAAWSGSADDGYTAAIPIGDPFWFYGNNFSNIYLCTNGLVTFDPLTTYPTYNQAIPSTTSPFNLIDFCRRDMYVATGLVKYKNDLVNNRFVISYDSVWFYNTPSTAMHVQIILNRTDSSVVIQYGNMNPYTGTNFTIGVENGTGTTGLSYYYSSVLLGGFGNLPYAGLAIKFAKWHPPIDAVLISHDRPVVTVVGNALNPAVSVKNAGTSSMTFDVKEVITGPAPSAAEVFNTTETTASIDTGVTTQYVYSAGWTPASTGQYAIYDSVFKLNDAIPSNNTKTATGYVINSTTMPISTTFESDNGGFVGFGDWQWGAPNYVSGPPPDSIPSPTNLWGTNLTGDYTNGILNPLFFPAVTLTGGYNFKLTFNMWHNFDTADKDGANLKISTDGVTWTTLQTSVPYDSTVLDATNPMFGQRVWGGFRNWTEVIVDVSAWTGQTIMLRLDQASNSTVSHAGLYIDNVGLVVILADVGVTSIDEPPANPMMAPGTYTVKTTIGDYTPLPSTFDVFLEFDGAPVDSLIGFFLNGNSSQQVIWPTPWVATPGSHTIRAYTVLSIDANAGNDSKSRTFNVIQPMAVPSTQTFDGTVLVVPPAGWNQMTFTGTGTWVNSTAKARSTPNSAYCYEFAGTNKIWLITPPIDLSTVPGAKLSFYEDQTYWSTTYQCHHSIMVIQGSIFGTTDTVRIADWTPSNHTINGFTGAPTELGLTQFNGQTIWIAFSYESSNYADDWWLDDVSLVALPAHDVGVTTFLAPIASPIQYGGTYDLIARILNTGANTETFDVTASDDHGFTNTQTVTDLAAFGTVDLTFPGWPIGTTCDPYVVTVATALAADTVVTGNNILSTTFTPVNPGNTSQVFDTGIPANAWRFLSPNDIIANRFDTDASNATLSSIAFRFTNLNAWPTWPDANRDSVVAYIFVDTDNNGVPDATPLYSEHILASTYGWTVWQVGCHTTLPVNCMSFWAGWAQLDSLKPEGIILDATTDNPTRKWVRSAGSWSQYSGTTAGDNFIHAFYTADTPTPPVAAFGTDPVIGDAVITRIDTVDNTLANTGLGCDLRYTIDMIQSFGTTLADVSSSNSRPMPGEVSTIEDKSVTPINMITLSGDKGTFTEPSYPPMILGSGGPDSYGYRWNDSDAPGGPVYSWVDISTIGTVVTFNGTNDDSYTASAIPMGMTFNFYGANYTNVWISTNGFATFTSLSSSYASNTTIPGSAAPNAAIYPEWDDLNGNHATSHAYTYHDVANNRFIISWVDWDYYYTPYSQHSFEIILNGNDNSVVLQYGTGTGQPTSSSTVGIENDAGTIATQIAYNQTYLHGSLAIKIAKPTIWLTTDLPTYGVIGQLDPPRPFKIFMSAAQLPLGTYNGGIALYSNNPAQPVDTLPVAFTVNSVIIGVAPTAVAHTQEYGTEADYLADFSLTNTGTGTLIYTASNTKPWITLSNYSGSVAPGGSLPFDIHVNTVGLLAGIYTDSVTYTSNDPYTPIFRSPRITITVTAPNIGIAPATISVTQETDVNRTYVSEFTISNTGTSALNWTATNSLAWLTLGTTTGTIPASGNQPVDMIINTAGITPGTYNDVVHIASNDPDEPIKNLPVTIIVSIIGVNPNNFNFEIVQNTQVVNNLLVGNGSGVPVSITLVANPTTWLSVSPAADTIPAHGNKTAHVTVNATGLAPGPYHGSITITSNNIMAAVVVVPVDIIVVKPPVISVIPASIAHVQESDVTMTYANDFTVSNIGDRPLNWTANSSLPWVTPMIATGTIPPAGHQNVDIRVNTAGITPGVYPDIITISSNDPVTPSVELPVTVTVSRIAVSWDHLDINVLEGSLTQLDLDVFNGSAVNVMITLVAYPADWLSIAPGNDTISAHGSITARVTIDVGHLPVGVYHGTITITSDNIGASVIVIPVNVTIGLSGCDYIVGDVNNNRVFNGLDVVYAVSYFKGGDAPPFVCECTANHSWFVAGDVNASCNFNGLDVTTMVAYFKGFGLVHPCPDCPPIDMGILKAKTPIVGSDK